MPFDIENSVKWDSNYLKGYTSERRDTNVEQLKPLVDTQAKDVARFSANKTLELYDRGVRWDSEHLDIKGRQWKTAYLPVWLYSYQEKRVKMIVYSIMLLLTLELKKPWVVFLYICQN